MGYVPDWPGAHSHGASLDELRRNLQEVVEMLLEDGDPKLEAEFVGVQTIQVAWVEELLGRKSERHHTAIGFAGDDSTWTRG